MAGTLFIVATPIGNLGDITLRAIETLRAADRVLAEDTRRSRALLSHLKIEGKRLERLDAAASESAIQRVVDALLDGESMALVTDAGTPVVSDPGSALVAAAARSRVAIVPIPGASAVTAALAVSGLATGGFRFVGFLPRAGEPRREALARLVLDRDCVVLFEAPVRTAATLVELARFMPTRRAVVARELTKLHEEILRGTLAELAELATLREWLGEVTLVLGPSDGEAAAAHGPSPEEIDQRIDDELARGRRAKDIAEALAVDTGRPRRELYARVLGRRA
jgi:16S rRNA (cytidine1402-2'-O)-methyltransferase